MSYATSTRRRQRDRPMFLRQLSTDEYAPVPYLPRDLEAIARVQDHLAQVSWHRSLPVSVLADGRTGTAAGLLALNETWNERFYDVPPDAATQESVAEEAFNGPETVIDVQTHFMSPRALRSFPTEQQAAYYRSMMPEWWTDLDEPVRWDIAAYLSRLFLESENALCVLSSGPGLDDTRMLFNDEMAATRTLLERFGGSGRLLTHAVVHANVTAETAAMQQWRDELRPAGWKVYTLGHFTGETWVDGWMLDDEETGIPFLEKVRDLGPRLVCTHKGISQLVDNGSPRDVGPAARRFPELTFVVYHSGYEVMGEGVPEGPYTEETADQGVNRLIHSVLDAGIAPGGNVYAELGTTWFALVRRPLDAAHVLGKLIRYLGEDNVLWGSDGIWYGSPQPVIDAFRAFQIPDSLCERYGYAKLTPAVKDKILSRNAARVYDVDLDALRTRAAGDDLAWARAARADVLARGLPGLRT